MARLTSQKARLIPLPVLLSIIICVAAAFAVYALPHCVSADKIARVHPGMSMDQVIEVLGPPAFSAKESDGSRRLAYGKPTRWCTVDVHLDTTNHVQAVFHDH